MARPSWLLALLPLLALLAGAGGHSHTSEENRQKAAADAARAVRATERVGTQYRVQATESIRYRVLRASGLLEWLLPLSPNLHELSRY